MLKINLDVGCGRARTIFEFNGVLSVNDVWENIETRGFTQQNFYMLQNGKILQSDYKNPMHGEATLVARLPGGKGGFGSMLRAIGAQIEKTTNREACRDLSGRRLRDINEEKRLKAWIEKQASRKEEEAERKRKKLERLVAEPKHEFKDQNYERERSVLTEKIDDAVEEGFKIASASGTSDEDNKKEKNKGIKRKTILDDFDEIDSDELTSTDDEEPSKKLLKSDEKNSSDSGCSSSIEKQSQLSDEKSIINNDGAYEECDEEERMKRSKNRRRVPLNMALRQ